MLELGLVSVSFRNLSVEEIVEAANKAGLTGIEWGGDSHVLPGDFKQAEKVKKLTEEAGLKVASYGSYYIAGEHSIEEFQKVLETAKVLGAPVIRIWAGDQATWRAEKSYVDRVIRDTRQVCELAEKEGIQVSYEYHGWTLTDNRFSALDAHREIGKENMFLYWQPNFCLTQEENLLALKMVQPCMKNVHVFYWDCLMNRFPMEEGRNVWKEYLEVLKKDSQDHFLMFEFVKDDSVEQLVKDAKIIKELLE